MTTTELIDKAYQESQAKKRPIYPSRAAAEEAVKDILGYISGALASGDSVRLTGFGKFEVKETKPRMGHNPQTKELMEIPAGKRVKFTPGRLLMNDVKG